jgi:hypothetical protein
MAATSSRTEPKYSASGHRDDDGDPGMGFKYGSFALTLV